MMESAREWYFIGSRHQHQGPYATEELRSMLERGVLKRYFKFWKEGSPKILNCDEFLDQTLLKQHLSDQTNYLNISKNSIQGRIARDQRATFKMNAYWEPVQLAKQLAQDWSESLQIRSLELTTQASPSEILTALTDQSIEAQRMLVSHQNQISQGHSYSSFLPGIGQPFNQAHPRVKKLWEFQLISPTKLKLMNWGSITVLILLTSGVSLLPWESWRQSLYTGNSKEGHFQHEMAENDFQRLSKVRSLKGAPMQVELATDKELSHLFLTTNVPGNFEVDLTLQSRPGEVLSEDDVQYSGEVRFIEGHAQLRDVRLSGGEKLPPGVYEVNLESRERDKAGQPLFSQKKLMLLGFNGHQSFVGALEQFKIQKRREEKIIVSQLKMEWNDFYKEMRSFRQRALDVLLQYPSGPLAAEVIQENYLKGFGPSLSELALRAKEGEDAYAHIPRVALFYRGLYDLARAQGEYWSEQWEKMDNYEFLGERMLSQFKAAWMRDLSPLEQRAHDRLARLGDWERDLARE